MASITSYKRLAEVRILHSFYLENDVDKPFYKLSEEEKSRRLMTSGFDTRDDLDIVPTEGCRQFLKEHKCVLLPTFTGFFVAIEVENSAGLVKPKVVLPENWRITFQLIAKNPHWLTFTNVKFKTAQSPLCLYWTNDNDVSSKMMPSLAAPLADFDASKQYEMGEWTMKNNVPSRAQDNNGQWADTEKYRHYATEADRRALSRQCTFVLPLPMANKARLFLTKKKTKQTPAFEARWVFESGTANPLSKIRADFTFNPIDNSLIPYGFYQFEIRCEDKDGATKTVTYDNIALIDGVNSSCFGVVELAQHTGLPNKQKLLNDDGSLVATAPVFEIRLQNRITYWQYKERRAPILNKLDNKNHDILDVDLATKIPHALTRAQLPLDFAENIQLPSPSRLTIQESNNRYYTEVIY